MTEDCKVIFGPAKRPLPQLKITVDDEGYLVARRGFHRSRGPELLGAWMSTATHSEGAAGCAPATQAAAAHGRSPGPPAASPVGRRPHRRGQAVSYLLKKVFPDHWSFMLGEIAMYSLVVSC